MEENQVKNIIHLYFGKHFSKRSRILFGRWLQADEASQEKEEVLRKVWDEASVSLSGSTYGDWLDMKKKMGANSKVENKSVYLPGLLKYAAVIALMVATAAVTAWLTQEKKQPVASIAMTEFFVPYGESRMLTLPDSSKVWVDAGSLLVYPEDFGQTDTRTIYLTGEASFSVRKNQEKPFIVKTPYLDVEALGTVFTVQAYPSDQFTSATLEKGSIRVDVKGESIQSSVLKPNEQLIYSHQSHAVDIFSVDASMLEMERNGYQIFENVTFERLMAALERRYNVVIHYSAQKYGGKSYNVKFAPDETVEDVLNVLHQLIGVNYKIKESVVYIN